MTRNIKLKHEKKQERSNRSKNMSTIREKSTTAPTSAAPRTRATKRTTSSRN